MLRGAVSLPDLPGLFRNEKCMWADSVDPYGMLHVRHLIVDYIVFAFKSKLIVKKKKKKKQ